MQRHLRGDSVENAGGVIVPGEVSLLQGMAAVSKQEEGWLLQPQSGAWVRSR